MQHDEATSHFSMMIDQTTRGHDFLLQTFNVTPTVAWQIDPFGHSNTQVCHECFKATAARDSSIIAPQQC